MKKSNKVLLYGLLASILLILLCLYTHQDEFMNQEKELVMEAENQDDELNSSAMRVKEDIEKSEPVEKVELKEKEPEEIKVVEVPTNMATVEQASEENDSISTEENGTLVEDNLSNTTVKRTIFKNKEEIKLKEHPKTEAPKEKIEEVDKHLPIEDNTPLIENDKTKKKEESNKKEENQQVKAKSAVKDSKKESSSKKTTNKKVTSKKSLSSIQESISSITNRNISFYKNKAKITDKSRATLNKVIKILKTVPNAKITVKGYTDASGKEKTNLWISQERAKSVKKYLGKHGIPLKNIVAKGYGESELLYGDKPNSELNRRVEIEIRRK